MSELSDYDDLLPALPETSEAGDTGGYDGASDTYDSNEPGDIALLPEGDDGPDYGGFDEDDRAFSATHKGAASESGTAVALWEPRTPAVVRDGENPEADAINQLVPVYTTRVVERRRNGEVVHANIETTLLPGGEGVIDYPPASETAITTHADSTATSQYVFNTTESGLYVPQNTGAWARTKEGAKTLAVLIHGALDSLADTTMEWAEAEPIVADSGEHTGYSVSHGHISADGHHENAQEATTSPDELAHTAEVDAIEPDSVPESGSAPLEIENAATAAPALASGSMGSPLELTSNVSNPVGDLDFTSNTSNIMDAIRGVLPGFREHTDA